MKNIFYLFLLVGILAGAQDFRIGVKGGLNFGAEDGFFEAVDQFGNRIQTLDSDGNVGWHLGIFTRVGIGGLFLQPEILYTNFKTDYGNAEFTKNRIDLPINLGKKILGLARIQAGPVFSYYFEDDIDLNGLSGLSQDDFGVGGQVGAGIDFAKKWSLDARYEFAFGDRTTEFISDNTNFSVDERPNLLRVSLGYSF